MGYKLRTGPSGPRVIGSESGQLLQWNGEDWDVVTPGFLFASIGIDITPVYSAGNQQPMANQPASSGSVVTSLKIPKTPISGSLARQVFRTGPDGAFTLTDTDVGPLVVNLEGGPLGYVWLNVDYQFCCNTTHNSANVFYFGVSNPAGGVRPQIPSLVRMANQRFFVSGSGRLLVPGGGRDVSAFWTTYYGADPLLDSELVVNYGSLVVTDTGKRL